MKKHVCAAALALCFVLAACAPEPGASSASVPSTSAAASSLPPASGTAGQAADLCITPCAEAACGA